MNWLTWRQYRGQALAGYAALAAVCAVLVFTGFQILHSYNLSGLIRCVGRSGPGCGDLQSAFSQRYNSMQFLALFILVVPVLVGMFWGAPLVARELENGTHRLAWTQSVSRRRWIVSKLAVIGGSTLVFSSILAAAVTWWSRPLVATGWAKFEPGIFDLRGFVSIGYTLFALALGIAAGVVIRKTLPAVFVTLAGFTAVRLGVVLFLRRHYMAAKTITVPFGGLPAHRGGDWILSRKTIDSAGIVFADRGSEFNNLASRCPGLLPSSGELPDKGAVLRCVTKLGLHETQTFHPAARYWTFQTIETAIFLVLTALLVAFIIRRVKRIA